MSSRESVEADEVASIISAMSSLKSPNKSSHEECDKDNSTASSDIAFNIGSDVNSTKDIDTILSPSKVALASCLEQLSQDCKSIRTKDFFDPNHLSALDDTDRKALAEAISISNFDNRGVFTSNGFIKATSKSPMKFRYVCPRNGSAISTLGKNQVCSV